MARLSVKHRGQETVTLSDFTGGLNTSVAPEELGEKELSECVNLEPDPQTGKLKTVDGCKRILTTEFSLFGAAYDRINKKYLLFSSEGEDGGTHNVYVSDLASTTKLGALSGALVPVTCLWEDGLLVASGGKLQYYDGKALVTLDKSPDGCDTVFIRTARVVVGCPKEDKLHYSSVGDETTWTDDTDDASSSKSLSVGYKDGGHYVAAVNLSDDVLLFKDNGYVYRLTGDYPDWTLRRVSHEVPIDGRLSAVGLGDSVAVLGEGKITSVRTTVDYGDMRAEDVAANVREELADFRAGAALAFLPALTQVWLFGTDSVDSKDRSRVLFYDLKHGGFYLRQFCADVLGAFDADGKTVLVRSDGLSRLSRRTFVDDGRLLRWRLRLQRRVSYHEFLLKRCQISLTPFFTSFPVATVHFGRVPLTFPLPRSCRLIYGNTSPIYRNPMKIYDTGDYGEFYSNGDLIYENDALIYKNRTRLFATESAIKSTRCVYRNRVLDIYAKGATGSFTLNYLRFDVAEV